MYRSSQGKENLSIKKPALTQSTDTLNNHNGNQVTSPPPPLIFFCSILLPSTGRKPPPTSTAPEESVRTGAAWIAEIFKLWAFWGYIPLQHVGLLQRGMWMQETSGPGASQHSPGGSTTALEQQVLVTTLSQLTGSRSTRPARIQWSLLWKRFLLANPKTKGLALSQYHLEA